MASIYTHTSPSICFTYITLICSLLLAVAVASNEPERKVYVAYMGDRPKGEFSASALHSSILLEVGGSVAAKSLLHSYRRSFNGFVANLTEDEARKLAERENVVSVFPNEKMQLQTTRSWDFMGFSKHAKRSSLEGDIIVGMFDTGIWPTSKSFSDENFGPPPKKWKGKCQKSANFTCNNKIIGARSYRADGVISEPDVASPLDTVGHGSHTASTAAGNIVQGASMLGLGLGDARGGVPAARLAVYKICWNDGCPNADILAAFDDAIADGVDIISLSIGTSVPLNYFEDPIAIGSFHAMKNGILTSHAAGNDGPSSGSTSSVAPWILSVAASTLDRKFVTKVQLGNGKIYEGISINTFDLKKDTYPFIYGGDAGLKGTNASDCAFGLDEKKVKGKIVMCDAFIDGTEPAEAGAAGVVMQNGGFINVAYNFLLPASYMSNGSEVFNYLKSTKKPTAKIFKSNTEKDRFAPTIASFSSRGPNAITPDILKPDVTAPGVDILAAWSGATTVTGFPGDKRVVPYSIDYGTSMACPHASGATAYIKSFYPKWSPAAIKSALMTTAFPLNHERHPDLEFSYGAGHINPANATNPGLVYDAGEIDYINFLCGQGYNSTQLKLVTGKDARCSKATNATVWDLNYPSFTLSASDVGETTTKVFHRTVTNVGSAVSTYKAVVNAPKGLTIQVKPSTLSFTSLGEKKSFVVTATVTVSESLSVISGSLTWDDGVHRVRSPVVGHSPFHFEH
ncbi:hypothetical protein SLA2020_177310 [Shorea laevis]